MVPLDATHIGTISRAEVDAAAASTSPAGAALHQVWEASWEFAALEAADGLTVHDLLAAVCVVDDAVCHWHEMPLEVDTSGGAAWGMTVGDRRLAMLEQSGMPAEEFDRLVELIGFAGARWNVALDAEDFEFVEVENISDSAIDLAGVRFTNGIEFDFTGSAIQSLAPGERAVVVKDLAAFTMRYGATAASRVAGEFVPGTGLGNNGERIVLVDVGNSDIANFRYETDADTGWPSRADGNGSSLVLSDTSADPSDGMWIPPSTPSAFTIKALLELPR